MRPFLTIGAAVAVAIGASGVLTTSASIDSGERGVYVPIAPCRLFDTRPAPDNVGPRNTPLGPGDTFIATVRGTNGNCTIPADAVGLTMNVAIVNPTTSSFLTVFPADVTRPLAANANWVAGQPPLSNAVTADISADGKIAFYNLAGNVDVAADIVGYYVDHTHDDRYYTKAQSDANYYSKAQSDANDRRGGIRAALDTIGDVGTSASLAIGADGNPVISYQDTSNSNLKVAKCSTPNCTGTVTVSTVDSTGIVGLYSSIAVGTDGNPVISYLDETDVDLKVAKCGDPACTGVATLTLLDTSLNTGYDTSIAIGADGNPIIAYRNNSNGDLKTAKCLNPACTGSPNRNILDGSGGTGDVGQYTSIAIRADGNPIISYYDLGGGNLKVAACTNPACNAPSTNTVVDSVGDVGRYTSIAIGVDGNPIISYGTASADVRAAHCLNPACTDASTVSTIDADGTSGLHTSIEIGVDGLPVIAYRDNVAAALKLAVCGNVACTGIASVAIVETADGAGEYASLEIGGDGLPIIVHKSGTSDNLRFAKCSTSTCAV